MLPRPIPKHGPGATPIPRVWWSVALAFALMALPDLGVHAPSGSSQHVMKLSDLHFELPPDSIAQEPARPRDSARLMVHGIARGTTRHRRVCELDEELSEGDLLVLNDTRVLPARLHARRESGGAVELLFVAPLHPADPESRTWSAMLRPARKLREGEELTIEPRRASGWCCAWTEA